MWVSLVGVLVYLPLTIVERMRESGGRGVSIKFVDRATGERREIYLRLLALAEEKYEL